MNKRAHTAYAIGKYGEAFYLLATEPDEIHNRLIVAAYKITAITEEMVPNEIKSDVKWLNDQLKKKETIEKSIKGRHAPTCIKIAKKIIYIYTRLNELFAIECEAKRSRIGNVKIDIQY